MTAHPSPRPHVAAAAHGVSEDPPNTRKPAASLESQRSFAHRLLRVLASLRLTVVGLGLMMGLVFVGTLAQVNDGIWIVQQRYFESWFIWKTVLGMELPLMPGGYLLGAVLLVNLLAAHALRWKITAKGSQRWWGAGWTVLGLAVVAYALVSPRIEEGLAGRSVVALISACSLLILPSLVGAWLLFGRRAGIVLIHVGLLVILGGEVATDVGSVEASMSIDEGATASFTQDLFANELALIDTTAQDHDTVYSIPTSKLQSHAEAGTDIQHQHWPITLQIDRYYPNARFDADPSASAHGAPFEHPADQGFGIGLGIREVPLATATNERDVPAAVLTVKRADTGESLGTWITSSAFREAQPITVDGRELALRMRPKQYPKPFSIQLLDFQHKKHVGTDIPSDFASVIRLRDPRNGTDRQARIFMNHPLRYDGLTFYQASFANNDTTSILQVVKNPAWLLPYLACGLMSVGMLAQFGGHLGRFGRRRSVESSKAQAKQARAAEQSPRNSDSTELGHPETKHSWPQRFVPWIVVLVLGVYVLGKARPTASDTGFDLHAFAALPVSHEGRVKPIDTVARSTLLKIYGKQKIEVPVDVSATPTSPDTQELSALQWLLAAACQPETADGYEVFTVHDPDVLNLLSLDAERKRFAFAELQPHLALISQQGDAAREIESAQRDRYQRAVLNLERGLAQYQSLKYAFAPERAFTFSREVRAYADVVGMMREGQLETTKAMGELTPVLERYHTLGQRTAVLTVPPDAGSAGLDEATSLWTTHGESLVQTFASATLDPAVVFYAAAREAYRGGDADTFNRLIEVYAKDARLQTFGKTAAESRFNAAQPFTQAMALYVCVFVLVCGSWLKWPVALGRSAWLVLLLAASLHTLGLMARMWIEGRPPVTNLYSSAVFVGWGAVVLGIVLEKFWNNGIGTATSAALGFATLIIAHHLALSGDTMEAMRAVLDSNFWLATHVVIITFGYAATFLAGFIAIIYVVRNALPGDLAVDRATSDSMSRMVYGILCFAVLFSFVGTVLGGIWADQSWGRFWGWDPKENGALLIVMWNAIILHARWGGIVKTRGVMLLAIFGNVVTAFSWFGVNMLGVGLHSYGFMDAAFMWIMLFTISQFALIALGLSTGVLWKRAAVKAKAG